MSRAQTEIIGFAMVVLLLSVGMLFILSFMILNTDDNIRRSFTDKQVAVNMNDAMLAATSTCRQLSFQRLIVDCADRQEFVCGQNVDYGSCKYLDDTLPDLFNRTLESWGLDYRWTVYETSVDEPIEGMRYSNAACSSDVEPGIFHLRTSDSTIQVRLDICN